MRTQMKEVIITGATGMIGSAVNAITVLGFAAFMLTDFLFGSYFVCIFLSISFIMSFRCL